RPRQSARIASLDAVKGIDSAAERVRTLFTANDKAGALLRDTLAPTLVYAAEVAPAIAYSIDDVDRAMQWGFGWELGPFELWDAIGVNDVVEAVGDPKRVALHGVAVQTVALPGLGAHGRFRDDGVPPAGPELQILKSAKDRQRV